MWLILEVADMTDYATHDVGNLGRVLLVDDEAMVRTLLAQTLEHEGFEVITAAMAKRADRGSRT